jgi:hypothetical protein
MARSGILEFAYPPHYLVFGRFEAGELQMDVRYTRIGYACTPKMGEPPVFSADVLIDGKAHQFKVRANDVFETWQKICRHLGIPFVMQH